MQRIFARAAGSLLLLVASFAAAVPQLVVPVATNTQKSGATAVRFNAEELFELPSGAEVELTLPSGKRHGYVYEQTLSHGGGFSTWIARSALTGDNARAIVTHGPAGSWGWMQTAHGEYRIYAGEGHDWLAERPPIDFTPTFAGGDAIPAPPDPTFGPDAPLKGVPTYVAPYLELKTFRIPKLAPTPAVQIDVMVLYTTDLASKLGAGLLPMVYNLIATTNLAYVASEVAMTLRLVNATMIDFPNSNGSSQALSGMRGATGNPNSPFFQALTWQPGTSLRNQVGADMVALLRDGPTDTGGIASLLFNPVNGVVVSTSAYSVNNYCATGCEAIFAHELGHNMGNSHDRATVARDEDGLVPLDSGVFPFSFGHYSCINNLTCDPTVVNGCPTTYAQCLSRQPNDFGTIMAYVNPRVMKFSNPNVLCVPTGGAAPGSACGVANLADNARSMNDVRQNVSAYRSQAITALPGSLQFTTTAYTGTETGGTITFTVSRASGSTGAIAVGYAVSGATATAGIDFTLASGTLSWANGDAANKTFSVSLTNDLAVEGIETLAATLSNPTGATGVYLGFPSTATGLILETWPAAGVAPAGFSSASTPTLPWALASDSSNDADGTSFKSSAFASSATGNSSTQYTGTFAAGLVSFAYRVSSYPGNGFFEFLVDGAVVLADSGGAGWKVFSTSIAAGAHTLEWRYRKTLSFFCANAIPPPPEGSACADRAWIDQVSLPLALASSTTSLASSVNPSGAGQAVTFTASISGSAGTATGTVAFRDGTATISGCTTVTVTSGAAACSASTLSGGTHSITALYSGSATYATSTSSVFSQIVSAGPQLLSANPSTLDFGGQSMNTTSPALTTTITNAHTSAVAVTSVTPPAGYSVTANTCIVTLAVGGTCQVTLTFTPGTQGTASGALAIAYAGGGPTTVSLTGAGERSLVGHYYRSILRRAADSGGKAFWEAEATRVQALGANVNEAWFAMAQSFYFSAEYLAQGRDNAGFVTDLYNTFFNRGPDAAGLSFWVGQLGAGMPREVVLVSYMFSAEFATFTQAIFGNASVRREVDTVVDFYRGLLSRLPDDGGFNFWVQRFRSAQCSGAAAVNVEVESISSAYAGSAEYAARNRSNTQFVADLYNAFLRRGGDLAGVQFWISQITTGARTRDSVRKEFIASPEFSARVSAIIQQSCIS